MEYFNDTLKWNYHPKTPLRVIIVGAGIGGLTTALTLDRCGHTPIVLEQVPSIQEVGAGIQMAPNACRVLGRIGVLERVLEKANLMENNSLRRYEDDTVLGTAPLMPGVGRRYGAPLAVVHRGELQKVLLDEARKRELHVRTGVKVVAADNKFEARVKTESGEWIEGDVVIAADGIKSDIRAQIAAHHGVKDESVSTGDAAYRVLIPKEKMDHDQQALDLLSKNIGMRWMGPGGHIMAYPIKNNTVYNMVLLHPEKPHAPNKSSWTSKGSKKEMLEFYSAWSPLVRNLLSYVPDGEVLEWSLNSHRPLPSWIENKVALMGDACHPMLPYVAQGAANAIEDAGVLACALSLGGKSEDGIDVALAVYQLVRKERAERIQNSASTTRRALHLPDGPEQRERDSAIAAASPGAEGAASSSGNDAPADGKHNPDLWADQEWQEFMWGTDVMKETVEKWEHLRARVRGHHAGAVPAAG